MFDAPPYIDRLLHDLGFKVNRKNGTFAEFTERYSPRDFVGSVYERVDIHGKGEDLRCLAEAVPCV